MITQKLFNRILIKNYCTKPKLLVSLQEEVQKDLENSIIKAKHHPGRSLFKDRSVPPNIVQAIQKCVKDYPVKSLLRHGTIFSKFLEARKPPPEKNEILIKQREILEQLDAESKVDPDTLDSEELKIYNNKRNDKLESILKQRIQAWQPIAYDEYKSLTYLMGRSAAEYAILMTIFTDISSRDVDFKPSSFFDFGSGVGTGVWAASKLWRSSIHEYCLVDASGQMNDLSALILRDGDENKEMQLKNVFHRQFLPSSVVKYDLVISAYSMLELSSYQQRMEVVDTLWNKCDKYLVFVERGTMVGFKIINEIRNRLINASAHVFSPCPHKMPCPRIAAINDRTPCNFEINYNSMPISDAAHNHKEMYSYVVFRKHETNDASDSWPRIVRPVLVRHKHAVCRMCTSNGKLQEVIFSPGKHGKVTYKCAKASKWGDRLPIDINETLLLEDDSAKE